MRRKRGPIIRIPFGKYRDKSIKSIPIGYLQWLLSQGWLYSNVKRVIQQELDRREKAKYLPTRAERKYLKWVQPYWEAEDERKRLDRERAAKEEDRLERELNWFPQDGERAVGVVPLGVPRGQGGRGYGHQ